MKHTHIYLGALAAALAVGCADTWDEHYNATTSSDGTAASQTLWELVSADENLSNFAQVAAAVNYYKDETHPQEGYTFQSMLDGTQLMTLWAPTNDALTTAEWEEWYALAQSNPYTVQQQLLANSITLWRKVATGGGVDTLTMLNGKKQVFDKDNFTMAGLPMTTANVAASNGTLHTVGATMPFSYNLYEYLKDASNSTAMSLSRFHDLIIDSDTTYFSEDNSIEGSPDENGNPTYVDSVYMTTNTMFQSTKRFPSSSNTDQYLTYDESFGANIESEDSVFVLLMPTDEAWQKAYTMLEPLYKYADIYVDKDKGNSGTSNVYRTVSNPDSLKEKCINMDILSPLCFNVNLQPNAAGQIGKWQIDEFAGGGYANAKYLLNTYGDTLRTDDTWAKENLMAGTQVEMSNGRGIIADTWNFPRKLYKPDLYIEIGSGSYYNFSNSSGTTTAYTVSSASAADWVASVGEVGNNNFYKLAPESATSNPSFDFKLIGTEGENKESEVMSGKYDIYLVMVPAFMVNYTDSVPSDTVPNKIRATISYCAGNSNGKDATLTTDVIEYTGEKVDSILLFEDFEFPYSYKNMRQCYPTLNITTKTTSTERKNGYSNTIYVDRIILKSKED